MDEKFELASSMWFKEIFRLFEEAAASDTGIDFSLCEVFTHVPERLAPDSDGHIAWHAVIKDGVAELAMGELPAEDVTLKTVAEWEAVLPAARSVIGPTSPEDLARHQKLSEQAVAEGRIQHFGDREHIPPAFIEVHNAIAARTR